MLLKAEFEANLSFLEPSIESMLAAGQGTSFHRPSIEAILTAGQGRSVQEPSIEPLVGAGQGTSWSLSLWRVAQGSKHMFLELIHGLFIT
jgi:hypothetical protein